MKNTLKRKELQTKLNHGISEFAGTIAKTDSKKIQKTIKKASKLIAKAILKNSDSTKVEVSLIDKSPVKAVPAKRTPTRRRTTTAKRKRTSSRQVVKSSTPLKTGAKINGIINNPAAPKMDKKELVK